ncbi:unnamed protein product [Lepeophtheirus salmonis]|uniref:(salmon louse) hypothetical protein n=1 Tax=Lepeophtheirus salmonis TaxID=72036 RepID=A0A7R8D2C6_LEPSM|nr:unnamed protein product [Lepeophtheirus salmonis]CAF3004115.1 unnamed protein product [Lepeophtheirus salmonis]
MDAGATSCPSFDEALFGEVFIPDLGSEVTTTSFDMISSTTGPPILPDNAGDEIPHGMELLDYILDDNDTSDLTNRSHLIDSSSSMDEALDSSLLTQDPKKFQIRIKPTKRKYIKMKKNDNHNIKVNVVKSSENIFKRPRGRPRIYKTPQDRPKYYYSKKDKALMKNSCYNFDAVNEHRSSLKMKNKTKDKMRRECVKTSLSKIKFNCTGTKSKNR